MFSVTSSPNDRKFETEKDTSIGSAKKSAQNHPNHILGLYNIDEKLASVKAHQGTKWGKTGSAREKSELIAAFAVF
jgi:hypothetical protein